MKNILVKFLFGNNNFVIGDVVKVVLPPSKGNRVNKGMLAICVDGEKEFPELYKQLISRVGLVDSLEFIWVKWIKETPEYYNQIDGAYAKYRFNKLSIEDLKIN
ncbi:MAG: hypothetical protein WC516_05115 [Patescibacteria group bacterium]